MLVASVNLLDIVYTTRSLCTHGGNKQGNTCTDIWTRHAASTKSDLAVVAYNHSAMGIAKDNLSAHIDQLVDKEQSALKHLLMEQYRTACLSGYDNEY